MSLKQLQTDFQNFIIHGKYKPMLPEVVTDHLDVHTRLGIYFNGYRLRLLEVLSEDYPKVHHLLGEEGFDELFIEYLAQFAPTHFSVRFFGKYFAQFLAEKNLPFLAEMATFEWAVSSTIDAKDGPIASITDLTAYPPDEWGYLTFTFHPSVTSRYLKWNTPQLWQQLDKEHHHHSHEPILQENPICWLFWRKGLRSLFQSCTPAEAKLFEAVQQGLDFAGMCETLIDIVPEEEIPTVAAQTLYHWLNEKMISTLSSSQSCHPVQSEGSI